MLSGFAAISSLEVEELDVEHQGGVGGNAARDSLGAVTHVRADGQLGSLAPGHLGHSLVPAGNNLGRVSVTKDLRRLLGNSSFSLTSPLPRVKEKGWPRSLELSTLVPLVRVST